MDLQRRHRRNERVLELGVSAARVCGLHLLLQPLSKRRWHHVGHDLPFMAFERARRELEGGQRVTDALQAGSISPVQLMVDSFRFA